MTQEDSDFHIYDAVTVEVHGEKMSGILTDVGYDTDRYVYEVTTRQGVYRGLAIEDIAFSHHLEAPFEFGSEVRVYPRDPSLSHLTGATGVVVGKSFRPDTGAWGFAVTLGDQQGWAFEADELVPNGVDTILGQA